MTQATTMTPEAAGRVVRVTSSRGFGPTKWQLLRAVEDCREPLAIKGTTLTVLRAMISLIKGDHLTQDRDDGHVCFASNATLADRAHVSIQTVERHISRLVELGLVARQASGNGKRWARRDGQGRVVLAAGLSLWPLAARHAELTQEAARHAEHVNTLAVLRDRCALALARLRVKAGQGGRVEAFLVHARNVLRRKPEANALQDLLDEIARELGQSPEPLPLKSRVSNAPDEGHKEPDPIPDVKDRASPVLDVSPDKMQRVFPKLTRRLRFARSHAACREIMQDLAEEHVIINAWTRAQGLGAARAFVLLGYVLERAGHLSNPDAYMQSLIGKLTRNELSIAELLVEKIPGNPESGRNRDCFSGETPAAQAARWP